MSVIGTNRLMWSVWGNQCDHFKKKYNKNLPDPTRNRKRRLEKWIRTGRTTRSSTSFGTCPKIRSKPEIRTSNNRKWKHDAEITTSFKSTRSTRRSRVSSTFSCETRSTFWNVKRSKKLGRDVILTTFLHFIKKL